MEFIHINEVVMWFINKIVIIIIIIIISIKLLLLSPLSLSQA